MTSDTDSEPKQVIARLLAAINRHDVEAFVGCFSPEYESEQPAHPARAFRGSEQVRQNWSEVFSSMSDFKAELLSVASESETVFAEWRWTATEASGEPFDWRGVTVMGVREGMIVWGRLYMEPVEQTGVDIMETVQQMTGR